MKIRSTKAEWVDQFNFTKLSEIHQAQFLVAGRNYFGPISLLEIFDKAADESQCDCSHYFILDDKGQTILYDFWVFGDDGGTLFNYGSFKPNGVVMIQSGIESESSDPIIEKLAEDIQRFFMPKRMTIFSNKDRSHNSEKYNQLMNTLRKRRSENPADKNEWMMLQEKIEKRLITHSS